MYHLFVRRIAHWAFEQLNAGHYEALLDRCTPYVRVARAQRDSIEMFHRGIETAIVYLEELALLAD
jgi:hypothetical protein